MSNKLTAGEKECLDAIREQNARIIVLEEWRYDCFEKGKQMEEYLKTLSNG